MIYLRRSVNLIMHCQTCEKGRGGRLNENSQSEQNVETLAPALKRWANEFRRYAADTGTLYAANLYATNLYATNL
jgi:hypothetical protein